MLFFFCKNWYHVWKPWKYHGTGCVFLLQGLLLLNIIEHLCTLFRYLVFMGNCCYWITFTSFVYFKVMSRRPQCRSTYSSKGKWTGVFSMMLTLDFSVYSGVLSKRQRLRPLLMQGGIFTVLSVKYLDRCVCVWEVKGCFAFCVPLVFISGKQCSKLISHGASLGQSEL